MDVYCPKCGEPTDNDELHNFAKKRATTYQEISAKFRSQGCTAIGMKCTKENLGSDRAQMAAAFYDIGGDDMDGVSGMMDDFGFMFS